MAGNEEDKKGLTFAVYKVSLKSRKTRGIKMKSPSTVYKLVHQEGDFVFRTRYPRFLSTVLVLSLASLSEQEIAKNKAHNQRNISNYQKCRSKSRPPSK